MSNNIWVGQIWALHTLPWSEELVAVAAVLEEDEAAEDRLAGEGVS